MYDLPYSLFLTYFVFLSIPFITALLFRVYKLPTIIGYIIGGIIVGNLFGGIVNSQTINTFAFFGIMLLLFTIGLEINLEKILLLKRFIIYGGLLTTGLSLLSVAIISALFGFSLTQSLLIGLAFASSSTSLIAKLIQDRGEETSFMGELSLGILMFQDLIFIPAIIIFSLMSARGLSPAQVVGNVVLGLIEATVILSLMYLIGTLVIPKLFDRVARSSRELLNLFVIIFIFFIGFLASMLHLPILISTFIAGVLVSQTTEHYHIFSQIRPMRDIFAIIFFVFIGTNVILSEVWSLLPQIILYTSLIVLAKIIIITAVFLYFRMNTKLSFTLGIFLFQVSESAFILLSIAYHNKVFTQQEYLLLISTVLLSLTITPMLINSKDWLYLTIRGNLKRYLPSVEMYIKHTVDFDHHSLESMDIVNHVVICGYGRVGAEVGKALFLANIPFIAIDYNFHLVQKARKEGIHIIYGDPTDLDVLDYAQVENAAILLSAVPERISQEAILLNSRKLNPNILVISRVHKHDHQQRMKDLGAEVIVQPEVEASLSIIKTIFMMKKLPKEEIVRRLRFFKIEQGVV